MGETTINPGGSDPRARALQALSELIASSEDTFILVSHDGTILHANENSSNAHGIAHRIAHCTRQQMPRVVLAAEGSRWRGEVAIENGESTLTFDVQVVRGDDVLAILARDISSSVRLQQQLAHLASHDALTDLPNRTHLLRRLADAIERAREDSTSLVLLYIDIDDLKDVNDSLGHELGDALIATIGRRLVTSTRPGDLIARIGGDEFVVLATDIDTEKGAADFAERVRTAVSGDLDVGERHIDTNVSVGVVLYQGLDGQRAIARTAESLLRDADKAMYHAKERGKSRCAVYTEDMRIAERDRTRLAADLTHVVERGELFLEYQPIASPHTGQITAAEALVRWQHPELGVLSPASFLTLAEEAGVDAAIGDWVMSQALSDLRSWIDARRVDGRFAVHVNVSRLHVERREFVDSVLNRIDELGLRPAQVVLEFNETVIQRDDGRAARALQALRRRGIHLSLDDFGSGTSSLTSLRSCRVDHVKLDGMFVRGLGEGDGDEPVVRGMIQLAHGFDAMVVAESVTSAVQVERLVALGCDLVQGFHIGQPLPAAQFGAGTGTVSLA